MSIIRVKARISKKNINNKLTDRELSDTTGGFIFAKSELYPKSFQPQGSQHAALKAKAGITGDFGIYNMLALKEKDNARDQKLGKLIGYCADCKCPVYSVTRKNHAGHNVITGAGR